MDVDTIGVRMKDPAPDDTDIPSTRDRFNDECDY
jgi:hypothetical protein